LVRVITVILRGVLATFGVSFADCSSIVLGGPTRHCSRARLVGCLSQARPRVSPRPPGGAATETTRLSKHCGVRGSTGHTVTGVVATAASASCAGHCEKLGSTTATATASHCCCHWHCCHQLPLPSRSYRDHDTGRRAAAAPLTCTARVESVEAAEHPCPTRREREVGGLLHAAVRVPRWRRSPTRRRKSAEVEAVPYTPP